MTNDKENRYKEKIMTIPNMLSFFRLCLIPIIMWLYIGKQNYSGTLIVLMISAASDIADGIIARRFNMVSDFGKAFDPIADKLTQAAMLFCLVSRFNYMMLPLALLVVKEVCSAVAALISIKKTKTVKGAVWHGKLTTVLIYSMIAVHLIWYNIPHTVSLIYVGICVGIMLMSFVMYITQHVKAIKNKR